MSAPEPGSTDWYALMSASKVAAVLGVSPWESPRSLWHKMRGDILPEAQTKVQARGHYLEAGVLAWWRDQHDLTSCETQVYVTKDEWACATLDALATDAHGNTIVVEVKTAARADEWGTPGTDEIPAYYAAQVMWQLALVPDAQFAAVAVLLGPGLDLCEYVVPRDEGLIGAITDRCRDFYDSLSGDEPPDLDDSVATFLTIKAIHPDIDPGAEVELTIEHAAEFLDSGDAERAAVKRARAAKTVVLDALGDAQYGVCEGLRVARRQPSSNGSPALYVATKTRLTKGIPA